MPLSDIVLVKTQLDKLSSIPIQKVAVHSLNEITQLSNRLNDTKRTIEQAFDNFEHELDQVKLGIKKDIEESEKHWFQESYKSYKEVIEWELSEDPDTIFKIRKGYVEDMELLRSRLRLYVDWKYAAIIIHPGKEEFIEDMVGFDPLYIIDVKHDLLLSALGKFPEQYQNRLRSYTITEDFYKDILDKIPDSQFGLCLAYNYLNYRPFEMIKKYLIEIYQKLKPGGTFILTFNDCDKTSAVKLVEKNERPYTPGHLIKSLARSLGYQIVYTDNTDQASTWLELRKPGELTSIKGGQSLAEIVSKPL